MDDLDVICRQLCESIDVIIDGKSGVFERNSANQLIESFKSNENILLLLNVSSKLLNQKVLDSNKSLVYNHFGLQLLETVIKFHWNSINDNLKQEIKRLIENWFTVSVDSDSTKGTVWSERHEWPHLMNAASRCVVEVLIRQWPQNWPNFMTLLLQRESNLSLYCIWQLSEDIGLFFKPNNSQRRREITNEFNNNLSQIYGYISKCLISSDTNLCLTAISTLNVMFEWTQMDANILNGFIQLLANDLKDEKWIQIKQSVCDCLLICLNRKQLKASDKTVIQTLLSDYNIHSVVCIVRKYIELNSEDLETQTLVKRLVSVMSGIGQQMITSPDIKSISSTSWNSCLQLMLSLVSHSNIVLNAISLQFWLSFVKHYKTFSNDICFDNSLKMSLISLIPHKISKQEFNKSILGFEFDDNEDFDSFFLRFRAEALELLRQLTLLDQKSCFNFVGESINSALNQSNNDQNIWEILAQISAAVFNKITDKSLFFSESNILFETLIERSNREDPNVISSQLSCLSALTVFLPQIPSHLLNEIIKRILMLCSFSGPGETRWTRTKEVKNLRRHACSLFIKICQTYPTLLVPLFQDLRAHIHSICADVQQFTQMEKCALNEALVLISNEFPDIELQKQFIGELISSINWIINYNLNAFEFIGDIGLNVDSLEDDIYGQKRANILYVVNLMLGLLKRVRTDRKIVLIPHLFPLIIALFPMMSNLNTIWRPEYREKCNENLRNFVFANITEGDKSQVLDMPSNGYQSLDSDKSEAYRIQTFVWSLHENCYTVLGLSIALFKPQIYDQISDFKPLLTDLEFLTEWKLRMIVKSFVKPLISNCSHSEAHYQKIVSILSILLPFLFNKINERWNAIKARNECSEEGMRDESEPIESEVVSDQINRLLSREFVELLICILTHSKNQSIEYSNQNNLVFETNVSDFGNYLLTTVPNLIIYPTAKALSWLDTTTSLKTCNLNAILIKKIITDNMIRTEDAVYFLFEQLMTGLSYFGEHEQNQSILLDLMVVLYEGIAIKMGFQSIKIKLCQISGSHIKDWDHFDKKLIENKEKITFPEKKKKEFMKRLLSHVIGKNIGQLYKYNSVEIKNLKPIFYTKNNVINDTNEDISLCLLFQ